MSKRIRYKPNNSLADGVGGFLRSEQMRDVTAEVASDIAHLARELAPRRKDRGEVPDGTAMADRFEVNREAGLLKVSGNLRVKVEVFNSAPSAAPNEFGGSRNRRHRMLGRAGARYGDFKVGKSGPFREDGTY